MVNRVCYVIVYSFRGKSRTLLCTLVLVDPYGRYYGLPFRSRDHIVDIIPHDQLLFFDHSFFHSRKKLASMMSPNCVTQLECVRGLLLWFGSLAILLFILSYLLYPWWSSSFEVDLPLSEALSFFMMYLTLGASDSCLLNCYHLFFETSIILLFL